VGAADDERGGSGSAVRRLRHASELSLQILRWHETCEASAVTLSAAPPSLTIALAPSQPADARCTSNASSRVTCHETLGLRPVLQSPQPWREHGFGERCAACHGGDPVFGIGMATAGYCPGTMIARVERKAT